MSAAERVANRSEYNLSKDPRSPKDQSVLCVSTPRLVKSRASPLGVLCITTVIPAKAGIQRGRATECKAKRQV